MKILFVHPNFPGQFLRLAAAMGQHPADEVVFLSATGEGELAGVQRVSYAVKKQAESPHAYVREVEQSLLTGEAVWSVGRALRARGFVPDVVYGHASWGVLLFLREVFPEAVHVGYCEWFMRSTGQYLDYGMTALAADEACRLRTSQSATLLGLLDLDAGVSPFAWQKQQFPLEIQQKITVLPDGVDTERFTPEPGGAALLQELGLNLSVETELVTYVSRGMEPLRGFPQFAAALAQVQRRRPHCHAVIVGKLNPAYETNPFDAERCLLEAGVDPARVHFSGLLPRPAYRRVLQASSVHVYLTKPFVLSWSFLDALSCGCAVVASATPPVLEVLEDGRTGFLAPFDDPARLAEQMERCLQGGPEIAAMRRQAREMVVERFSLYQALNRQRDFLKNLVARARRS